MDDQVLGTTRAQMSARKQVGRRSDDGPMFKWEGAERNIDGNTIVREEKDDPVVERKVPGCFQSPIELVKEYVRDRRFVPVVGENGQVDVAREPGFAPPKHRQAADEAKPQPVFMANRLNLVGSLNERTIL